MSKDGSATATILGAPRWRNDGKEIIFMGLNDEMLSVEVNGTAAGSQIGSPVPLLTAPANNGGGWTTDHKRLLLTTPLGQGAPAAQTPITVVLDWQADCSARPRNDRLFALESVPICHWQTARAWRITKSSARSELVVWARSTAPSIPSCAAKWL